MPAVPLFTNPPVATDSVCAPMRSGPSVWVTPAPAVNRSERIVALPVTVVMRLVEPKVRPELLASSSAPPASVMVFRVARFPKALALVVARRMPQFTVKALSMLVLLKLRTTEPALTMVGPS